MLPHPRKREGLSRRALFRDSVLLSGPLLFGRTASAGPAPDLRPGPDIYESIGVRPLINCRGTVTVIGGSLELPEVRAAADAASRRFVARTVFAIAGVFRFACLPVSQTSELRRDWAVEFRQMLQENVLKFWTRLVPTK